jgi:hypothetical protein
MSRARVATLPLSFSAEVSPVRTCPPLETAEDSEGLAPGFGGTSRASSGKYGRASSSSKTSRQGRIAGSARSAGRLATSDIERAPWGLGPPTLARCIGESACLLLPTLLASDEKRGSFSVNKRKDGRPPTPTLRAAICALLPTLTETGNLLSPSMQKWPAHRRLLPTLTAQEYGTNKGGAAGGEGQPERKSLRGLAGGSLSPTWCEWFMGFPEDWTALDARASATALSRNVRKSSAKSSGK